MLAEMRVRNLGVIADLTLELNGGMTALTGETGAGKTLVVEALQLVLGGRADPAMVRAGAEEAVVEARFVLEGPGEGREQILARTVPARGRSKATVDGRMVPVGLLAEMSEELVDIHGQHEHQSLLRPGAARRALDAFAGIDAVALREARAAVRALEARMEELGGDEHQRAREAETLAYQIDEIERAQLDDDHEDAALAAEESRLASAAALREAAAAALALLDGDESGEGGARSALDAAGRILGSHDPLAPWHERAAALSAELGDVVSELREVVETWEDDPARLEEVQARRRRLADLGRLYGPTLADVRSFADQARGRLAALDAVGEEARSLEARRAEAARALAAVEDRVGRARRAAAGTMGEQLTARLMTLAMPAARLEVAVGPEGAGDDVVILFGPNPGEPLLALARAASGGELARAMLALRLVSAGGPPTMVFDEVDAGVGGEAALALGRALREVGSARQVLVVTHLPQVAAMAHHHVAVRKDVVGERTVTSAEPLGGDERVTEISRMLSGHPGSATAQAHAAELLEAGRR